MYNQYYCNTHRVTGGTTQQKRELTMGPDQDRSNRHQLRTVRQASRLLEIAPHTLRAWITARKIGSVRLGRCVRVPLAEVERLIDDGRIPARPLR